MLAFLKFLSPKEWLIVACLIALAVGGAWLYRHGELRIEAQDKKLEAKQDKQVAAVTATAKDTESHDAIIYEKAVVIPPVGDIGVECVRKPTSAVSLPKAGAGQGATTDGAADSREGPTYDPSGPALTRGRNADAQIVKLQARIRELETQMNGAP